MKPRHYFGWVKGRYKLVICIGPYRPCIPWRDPRYDEKEAA